MVCIYYMYTTHDYDKYIWQTTVGTQSGKRQLASGRRQQTRMDPEDCRTGHVTKKAATIPIYKYIILIAGPLATRRV